MLTILYGADWTANRDAVLNLISEDVASKKGHRILIVPELISHDTERRLCRAAGDTCSRYAEVISFSRLPSRISSWSGCPMEDCLDNGGRLVAMAYATRQLHSKLKAYASMETKPEFLESLVDAIDEFKRCCITAEDLADAAKHTEGLFAQKLEELSLLLEAYESVCTRSKRDPRELLTWGLDLLHDCDFAQNHVFYIDGFPDFTRQNLAVLSYFIAKSPQVVISINCDQPGSRNLAFEKPAETLSKLLQIAQAEGVRAELKLIPPREDTLLPVCSKLFQGKISSIPAYKERIRVCTAGNIYEECVYAAEQIMELVRNGCRYRDISVVCPDMSRYGNTLKMYLQLCGIPVYFAGTEEILDKSVILTVISALDAALGGFDTNDVLRYAKSALSPLELDLCDQLENYVLLWGIRGKSWLMPFTAHPDGLVDQWSEDARQRLNVLNGARQLVVKPLQGLAERFRQAKQISQQIDALYDFLDEIQLGDHLQTLADDMNAAGDNRSAQILEQLWDILLTALSQMRDVLGQTSWEHEYFTRLFSLLLRQYDVGTIPPVLDTLMVGPVSAMRCQQAKHLLVVGAAEGVFPSYGSAAGILTQQERDTLRKIGVPLTGGASEGVQIEFSEIYGIFCGVSETIYVSCQADEVSFLHRRLQAMADGAFVRPYCLGAAAVNPVEAAAFLSRHNHAAAAEKLGIASIYNTISEKKDHQLGEISEIGIRGIYGAKLNLSASQADKQAECRLAYFLKYGLRAKERKAATVDPAEFGTYVHHVLENTAREICRLGGFKSVSLADTVKISERYSDEYIQSHFAQLESQRLQYLFQRNKAELTMVVEELWREFQESAFHPVAFELDFSDRGKLPAIEILSARIPAQLQGFVDRVDVWQEGSRNYFRVVDYKTGKKDFDYCDILNGLGLQMLLYLFTLEEEGSSIFGSNFLPAGVQYFPARAPILTMDGELSDEEAELERQKQWKRKGLILDDEDVLRSMEDSDSPIRLSCKRKKDGTLTGDIASMAQFRMLSRYVFHLLGLMVDDIASGNVQPNPYTRGSSYDACRFCPYGAVCHSSTVQGRRNYQAVSSQKFWEDIEKEMSNHA